MSKNIVFINYFGHYFINAWVSEASDKSRWTSRTVVLT